MLASKVFIFDPDTMIIRLLQASILGVEPSTSVISTHLPDKIIDVYQQSAPFDLVIMDHDSINDPNSDIFLSIRSTEPSPVLMETSYGYSNQNDPSDITKSDYIVQKPLDGRLLTKLFDQLLNHPHQVKLESLSLSEDQYKSAEKQLHTLLTNINARCLWLCDSVGHVLVKAGNADDVNPDEMSSLLGGGFATLDEAGKAIDANGLISLAYREGNKSDLYSINVYGNILLIIIIDKGTINTRLGTVWFYARQCAFDLNKLISVKDDSSSSGSPLGAASIEDYSNEIDKLFNMENE